MPERLPIYDLERDIVATLQAAKRLVLQAPTGSGKSTQVPQMLLKHGLLGAGQVVILQPRRLAARLLAHRVASELGVQLGKDVGYQVRFENFTSDATRIKFETEGILLRQLIQDPTLRGVQAILFDEFHERHLYGDITLARALDIQEAHRPDLLIAVMSATLDAGALEDYLSRVESAPHPPSGHPLPLRGGEGRGEGARPAFTCGVLSSEGRTFPVHIEYLPRRLGPNPPPPWELAAEAFAAHVRSGAGGDVLVFMPGGFEISQTLEALRHTSEARGYILLPLHGELPPVDQDAAVARYDQPKVVVSTNVAETSVTIDGVRLVIDSGLARIPRYDAHRGINTLLIEKISQSSADQRAGRAGRTAPGKCLRLWSQQEHDERPPRELPEIQRLDLAEVILTLKAAGVEDLRKFRWLEPPSEIALHHAEELLLDLGALKREPPPASSLSPSEVKSAGVPSLSPSEGERAGVRGPSESGPAHAPSGTSAPETSSLAPGREPGRRDACPTLITELGRRMLAFPVHPRYSRMLLAAQEHGCVYQACLVAALTQGRDLLLRGGGRAVAAEREDLLGDKASSDFWILMRAWNFASKNQFRVEACRRLGIHAVTARQVGPLFEQFLRIAKDERLDTAPREVKDEALQKCILIGFSDRVAHRLDQGTLRCELVHGRRGLLARESVVQDSPLFVAAEIREIEGRDGEMSTLLSLGTAIQIEWLRELFPEDLQSEIRVAFDATARRVQAAELLRFRDLALAAKRVEPPPADAAARLLAEEIIAGRLHLPNWDHSVEQWLERLSFLCRNCAELQLPPITDADRRHIIEQLCHGAVSYRDLKERDVKPLVKSWLSAAQHELLDQHAPERLSLSNGRTPKVTYEPGVPPFIALRIQELFGVTQTPRIAMGRVPVVVHILAPSMRPVQVTSDLAGFWREHYPRVKSELARKYPKHEWR
ncbi:MAG TPA: ATP-dependent RNA helicase [Verrucomicrobiae bacterium]|nr:ATP-dependent RNA helicase [Verrucomicrobiae bacterium]